MKQRIIDSIISTSFYKKLKQRKQTKIAVKMIANLDLEPMELELKDVNCKDTATK